MQIYKILRNFAAIIASFDMKNQNNRKLMKRIFTLAALVLALTGAQASVVINSTTFPDERLREAVKENFDTDENGTLSDAEILAATDMQVVEVGNLKGLEYLTNMQHIDFWSYEEENQMAVKGFDFSVFPNLDYVGFLYYHGLTSLDFSKNTKLYRVSIRECNNLSTLKLNADIAEIELHELPKLTELDLSQCPKLYVVDLRTLLGIKDLDFSNHPALEVVHLAGWWGENEKWELNSINFEGSLLNGLNMESIKVESLTLKGLENLVSVVIPGCDITTATFENCPYLNYLEINECDIHTLTVKNCPDLAVLTCQENKVRQLFLDSTPNLIRLDCWDNKLMFLDLSQVQKRPEIFNATDTELMADNQQPDAVAWRLSPTEVGLKAHSRMDPARMKNLKVGGKSVTATETTIDGIRYVVFYDDGVNVQNVVGRKTNYEYETHWPYAWVEGNSTNNNLPVALNITSWTKPASWIKIDGDTALNGEMGSQLPTPTVLRSQDYDGKLTWRSSNENAVKVNADTGALTIVGYGTATITITGAETDYRQAPAAITFTVNIPRPTGIMDVNRETINNNRYYDLQGRRVDGKPARGGVYIVRSTTKGGACQSKNGKKVLK